MDNKERQGFRTVQSSDMEEYNRKLRKHRMGIVMKIMIVAVLLLVTVLASASIF